MKRILEEVEEYNFSQIGEIIGNGTQSIVIDCYQEFRINISPTVMVITLEERKFEFLSSLSGINNNFFVEEVILDEMYSEDSAEYIQFLIEEYNLSFFYMKEGTPLKFNREGAISKALREITQNNWSYNYNSYNFPTDYIITQIEELFEFYYNEQEKQENNDNEEEEEEEEDYYYYDDDYEEDSIKNFKKVMEAIKDSFQAIETFEDLNIKIDLHEDQFLMFDRKIVCSDPFLLED